jgi:YidC/Oxa1 family membrane protein insertase
MGFFELFSGALGAFYAVVQNYGVAIILLTIAVRLILLPLSIKQIRSMREMQRIQPEIKRLQTKYKGDRQKLNEEMMKLYKEHGVNPLAGCLPLLSQAIVLIPLFQVLRAPLKYMGFFDSDPADRVVVWTERSIGGVLESIQQSSLAQGLLDNAESLNNFLGFHLDCSAAATLSGNADPTIASNCGSGFISALPYLLLLALMGLTTYIQQKQMQASRGPGDSGAAQMQMIGKIMPVFLMLISYTFAAGVVLYWLTTNLWMIGQQRLMFRAAPPLPPLGKGEAKAAKGGGKVTGKAAGAARPSAGKPASKKSTAKNPTGGDGKTASTSPSKPHPSSKKKKKR